MTPADRTPLMSPRQRDGAGTGAATPVAAAPPRLRSNARRAAALRRHAAPHRAARLRRLRAAVARSRCARRWPAARRCRRGYRRFPRRPSAGFRRRRRSAPLPEFKATVTPRSHGSRVGRAAPGLAPAVTAPAIYAAASDGTIVRIDPATGATAWRITPAQAVGRRGRRRDARRVGTNKGDVSRSTPTASRVAAQCRAKCSSPPKVTDGLVVVWSRRRPASTRSSRRRQDEMGVPAHQPAADRAQLPPAASSAAAGCSPAPPAASCSRIDLATGNVGWEGNVATPKGATELERIADITSLPVVDERQVCAVAFQGRVACFDRARHADLVARHVEPRRPRADDRCLYVTDDAARCTRSTRRPAAPCGSRTSSRRGGRAARSSSATTSAWSTSRATCTC